MSLRKNYIKERLNSKLRRVNYLLQLFIFLMTAVVLYDAFVHDTPLYYILFYVAGLVAGRVYKHTRVVHHKPETNEFILTTSKWDILISAVLILMRFVFSISLLKSMDVIWASDALYLFFIGIYRSKWKGMVKQIDEIVYQWNTK